ncbi:MAG: hypothetical protein FD138_2162, partial [Planctomycetota bacterium]
MREQVDNPSWEDGLKTRLTDTVLSLVSHRET